MSASTIAAWLAVIGTAFGLCVQAYTIIKNRRKERTEMQEALSKAPYIRQQLELGNFGSAIEQLNRIITLQAAHIDRQEDEIKELRAEVARLRIELRNLEGTS